MLLQTGLNSSGAYYLAGYAVECAIKACIARNIRAEVWPPKANTSQEMYTHDLNNLMKLANLKDELDTDMDANLILKVNWGIVKDWSEQKRYEISNQLDAQALITAITDTPHGVLAWLQIRW